MHTLLVTIHVKPEHLDAFLAATLRNHEGSTREPGNLRFDLLRATDDPSCFLLIEVYRTAEDAAAHRSQPHYLAWRDEVAPWMAAPREGKRWEIVEPADPERWVSTR